jgi:predicted transcriptional regulator
VSFLGEYRSRLQIVRDILLVASVYSSAKKTHIMYGANMGYSIMSKYLKEVLRTGLLESCGKSSYRLTEKGKSFLALYDDYEGSLKSLQEQTDELGNKKKTLIEFLSP